MNAFFQRNINFILSLLKDNEHKDWFCHQHWWKPRELKCRRVSSKLISSELLLVSNCIVIFLANLYQDIRDDESLEIKDISYAEN